LPARVQLSASERINPDGAGLALPTVVRVYQLLAIARMEEADFATIWQAPVPALGPDLLAARELTMFPGQSSWVELSLKPEVRFLVAVAIFRVPTATQWRAIVPLPDSARMCAAYQQKGAPSPAVTFRFDQYRAEGQSRLFAASSAHELPHDVAPPTKPRESKP
jgi:type VI secretion system VasD/TssJ family lipoprotein